MSTNEYPQVGTGWAFPPTWGPVDDEPGTPPTPAEQERIAILAGHYRWAVLGLVVAVIGAAVLAGSLCIRGSRVTRAD